MIRPGLAFLFALIWAEGVAALDLDLPSNARETASRNTQPDSYVAPIAVFADGALPGIAIEGEVRRSAFRVSTAGLTPLQLTDPLRDQLVAAGYKVILDCAARECGGFDFRFATETLPAPGMNINLRAYRFLTAVLGPQDAPDQVVTILSSASTAAAHIQIIRAGDLGETPDQFTRQGGRPQPALSLPDTPPPETVTPRATGDIVGDLTALGRATLPGLDFGTGAVALTEEPSPSLEALAGYLTDNPQSRVALVGHTDNTGALAINTDISRQRASVVRQRLIESYGIAGARIEAHGVGYLAPIESNATPEGRQANRRVEVVLLTE